MNERIRELAEQAGFKNIKGERLTAFDVELQQFAELIVLECADVADCYFYVDGLTLSGILKEHFGVRE